MVSISYLMSNSTTGETSRLKDYYKEGADIGKIRKGLVKSGATGIKVTYEEDRGTRIDARC